MQVKLCPKCGLEIGPDQASCSGCHASLEGSATTGAAETALVKRGSNWKATVLLVLLLGGAMIFGWQAFLKSSSPEGVTQKYLNAGYAGDYDGMKPCLSKESLAQMARLGVEKALREGIKETGPKQVRQSVVKTTYEDSGLHAIVALTSDGSSNYKEMVLVKEDGAWKIDMQATAMRAAGY